MKRMHIHIGVDDIENSVKFYNALFGAEPVKLMPDYAKWMLEDPRINFAISTRVSQKGVNHLGLQVDNEVELNDVRQRLQQADIETFDDGTTVCCYAESEKSWVRDPAGVAWEAYQTMADAQIFSAGETTTDNACCIPVVEESTGCCDEKSDNTSGCC